MKTVSLAMVVVTALSAVNGQDAAAPAAPEPVAVVPVAAPVPDARVTPVSGGDAVIEPFWDPALDAWKKWTMAPGGPQAAGKQSWCLVTLDWTAAVPGEGPTLIRAYAGAGLALGPYSQLVLSAGFPKETRIALRAVTDAGRFEQEFVCSVSFTDQHVLPLPGSKFLQRVEITFGAVVAGPVNGNLLWLGLRSPQLAETEAEQWRLFSAQPLEEFLRDEPAPTDSVPLYNLLCPAAEFAKARDARATAGAPSLAGLHSEVTLAPHLTGGANQNLFGRRTKSRDRVNMTLATAPADGAKRCLRLRDAAQEAALAGDPAALREVAKAAMQIALIPHWDVDFITEFPGSGWDQRCFSQADACYALAVAFDMAGAYLTPAGRSFLLRRLAEEGLGNINYVTWRYPYIFGCNQLPVFSCGRLAVYSLLEKQTEWGHVAPYADLAFAELNESLAKNFVPDGGFPEGSGYLSYTLSNVMPALAIYGNARGRPLQELLPALLAKTDDYLEILRSTAESGKLILVADAQGGPFVGVPESVLSVLARIRPGGAAARLLAVSAPAGEGLVNKLDLWALPAPDLQGIDPDTHVPFVRLPETGMASSARRVGAEWGKLVVVGGPAKAGHNHEDRGSFVLEFAGDTMAADPGGLIYADSAATAMKHAQNHNLLVPYRNTGRRPASQNPAAVTISPQASGDAVSFNASFDPGLLWPHDYARWHREFLSPNPAEFRIVDDYELKVGEGVEFLWHTPLPVTRTEGKIILTGKRGQAVITPPADCEVRITASRRLGTRDLATVAFRHPGATGHLTTVVRLEPVPAPAP